jgi:hypothetical protein
MQLPFQLKKTGISLNKQIILSFSFFFFFFFCALHYKKANAIVAAYVNGKLKKHIKTCSKELTFHFSLYRVINSILFSFFDLLPLVLSSAPPQVPFSPNRMIRRRLPSRFSIFEKVAKSDPRGCSVALMFNFLCSLVY